MIVLILIGCQTASQKDLSCKEYEKRARAIIEGFIAAANSSEKDEFAPEIPKIQAISWGIAAACGYDFKWNIDGWEYWYLWITKKDMSVIPKCLESLDPCVQDLGIDIALSLKSPEYLHMILKKYAIEYQKKGGDNVDLGYQRRAEYHILCWLKGEGLSGIMCGNPEFKIYYHKTLEPNPELWRAIIEYSGWSEGFLRENGFLKTK